MLCFGLALAGCGRSTDVVHVYNWNDYITSEVLAQFEAETGIEVVYDVYDSNEILEARLMAGGAGYDLVFPTARPYAERQIEAGLYRRFDRASLTNFEHLDERVLATLTDFDPSHDYVVPYMWGTTGLGYNETALARRLDDDVPRNSWDLLFDPAQASRLADCGISVLDDAEDVLIAVLLWLGLDPDSTNPDDLDAAAAVFRDIRPYIRYFHSSQYINDLANGDICLAMGYSGDILQARDRAEEAGGDVLVAYQVPREGAVIWTDVMAIPADARNPDAAHQFVDFLLRPDVIAEITNYVAYANANASATELVDEDIRNDPGIYLDEETMAQLHRATSMPAELRRLRSRTFERIRTGR